MSQTYINQWCERTLDDSAIRRIIIPDSFMLLEHICDEFKTIISGLRVFVPTIDKHVRDHMPFIMTEKLLIIGSKQGIDRQELHENLRQLTINISNEKTKEINLEDLLFSQIEENTKELYHMYKSLSKEPIDYIGNIEEQIDNLLKYTRSFS